MDFADLDLRTASEEGSWLQLEHDGAKLFAKDGAPCRVLIRGMAADKVMTAAKTIERIDLARRERLARTAEKDVDAVLKKYQDDLIKAGDELIISAVSGWENIIYSGKPLPFSDDNVLKICGSGSLFVEQVRDAIMERKRLFTNAATDS